MTRLSIMPSLNSTFSPRQEVDEGLNYHHLRYFWWTVREGSVVAAARKLRVSQPAVSGQIRQLEESLGQELFRRQGKRLELTDQGQLIYDYAQRIFSLGREMLAVVRHRPEALPKQLALGVAPAIPSMVVAHLLRRLLRHSGEFSLLCHSGEPAELLGRVAEGKLDVVLTDGPLSPGAGPLLSRQMGQFDLLFFAGQPLVKRNGESLAGLVNATPMLLPGAQQAMRRELERWLGLQNVRPQVAAQIDSADLLLHLGPSLPVIFLAPAICKPLLRAHHEAVALGRLDASWGVWAVALTQNLPRLESLGLNLSSSTAADGVQ